MHLKGKKIVLAVTGSIAAYKTPHLVRLLTGSGAEVRVIVTPSAEQFVSSLVLSTLSRQPVHNSVSEGGAWNNHVELGRWADVMLIAPCSANTLAKLANGLCDNLVCAVYLSAFCPVFLAPAMDEDMWLHAATQVNMGKIRSYGNHVIPVGHGSLASGLTGYGRMAEPEEILSSLNAFFVSDDRLPLTGIQALVTAGPTYERLDPVRFIGNFSTGKMGIAIAESLARKGASVTLVLGPSVLKPQHAGIRTVPVESAEEMYEQCLNVFPEAKIAVLAAAVADYKPEQAAKEKIKKQGSTLELTLARTKDILATLGAQKSPGQVLVGFALETDNEENNAERKLVEKNADLIVLNSLKDEQAGFGYDTNKVTLIGKEGSRHILPLQLKNEVADIIVNHILKMTYEEEVI